MREIDYRDILRRYILLVTRASGSSYLAEDYLGERGFSSELRAKIFTGEEREALTSLFPTKTEFEALFTEPVA